MHDFKAVTGAHGGFVPGIAREDVCISLDCHPIWGEPQVSEQSCDIEPCGNVALIAVDHHLDSARWFIHDSVPKIQVD